MQPAHLLRARCVFCGDDTPTLVSKATIVVNVVTDEAWASWTCQACGAEVEQSVNSAVADNLLHLGSRLAVT